MLNHFRHVATPLKLYSCLTRAYTEHGRTVLGNRKNVMHGWPKVPDVGASELPHPKNIFIYFPKFVGGPNSWYRMPDLCAICAPPVLLVRLCI